MFCRLPGQTRPICWSGSSGLRGGRTGDGRRIHSAGQGAPQGGLDFIVWFAIWDERSFRHVEQGDHEGKKRYDWKGSRY